MERQEMGRWFGVMGVWLSLMILDLGERIRKRRFSVSLWYAVLWETIAFFWAARALFFN